MAVDYNQNNHS